LRVTSNGPRYGGGREGGFQGAWRSFDPIPRHFDPNQFGEGDEQQGQSEETGEEETRGNSVGNSTAPGRSKGATSALRPSLLSPVKASDNQGTKFCQEEEEIQSDDGEEHDKGRKQFKNPMISGGKSKESAGRVVSLNGDDEERHKGNKKLKNSKISGGERWKITCRDSPFNSDGEEIKKGSKKSRLTMISGGERRDKKRL
jgi:hypothetical protein